MPLNLELGRPLVALLVAGVAAGFFARRRPGARGAPRVLFALALALAAGDLSVRDPDPPRLRVFVVDRSRSFAGARAAVASALELGARDLDPVRDEVAFVAFGARPVVVLEPSRTDRIREGARNTLGAHVDDTATDIGAALDLARDLARARPLASEVVLVTDGRDTAGRAREAAALLAASGVALHAVAPAFEPPPNARVARVLAPSHVGEREPARVVVEVESSVEGTLTTTLSSDDLEVLGDASIRDPCEAFVPLRRTFIVRARKAGVFTVKATVRLESGRDAFPDDDELEQTIVAGEASRAVVVSRDDAWSDLLASFDVTREPVESLAALLTNEAKGIPDLVVLDEVPAAAAPVAALRKYLEVGGGLVVSGDEHAFGPGLYAGSDLEKLLPVRSGPPDERARPLALEVVLDASGSMGDPLPDGRTRYEAAYKAVLPATKELRPGDQLDLVTFDGVPTPTKDPASVNPQGPTDIAAALVMGIERLASKDGRRLLVLVTDGGDEKALARKDEVATLAAKLGADARLAFILIGSDEDGEKTLRELTQAIGKQASFFTVKEAGDELKKLVQGDLVQGSLGNVRKGLFPLTDGSLVLTSYAPVHRKGVARPELSLRDPERQLPAELAVSGERVLCLATNIARGGAPLAHEGKTRLLELVRAVVRHRDEVELRAERTPGSVRLVARTARTGLVAEDDAGDKVPLRPVAPSLLEATLPGRARLIHIIDGGKTVAATIVAPESTLELAPPPRDTELLEDLVAPTHGTVLPELGPLPRPHAKESLRRSLAPWLALVALALLVLEEGLLVLLERLAARRAAARAFESH